LLYIGSDLISPFKARIGRNLERQKKSSRMSEYTLLLQLALLSHKLFPPDDHRQMYALYTVPECFPYIVLFNPYSCPQRLCSGPPCPPPYSLSVYQTTDETRISLLATPQSLCLTPVCCGLLP